MMKFIKSILTRFLSLFRRKKQYVGWTSHCRAVCLNQDWMCTVEPAATSGKKPKEMTLKQLRNAARILEGNKEGEEFQS